MQRDPHDTRLISAASALLAAVGGGPGVGEGLVKSDVRLSAWTGEILARLRARPLRVAAALRATEDSFRRAQTVMAREIETAIGEESGRAAVSLLDDRRERLYRPLHDLMIDLKASSYDWVVASFGAAELFVCHRHIADTQRAGFTKWEAMTVEDHVRRAARVFALHLGRTEVVREAGRYRFTLDPCGTGGRMAAAGSLARPGEFHENIPGAHTFTFGRKDLPAYCAHCAVWNEIAATEWFGHPQWIFTPWKRAGEPCGFSIYTDLDAIPAETYARMNKAKPARLAPPTRAMAPLADDELATIGVLPSDLLRAAAANGEWSRARALAAGLGTEMNVMIKGLRLVLEPLTAWLVAAFERKLSEAAKALDGGDAAKAGALIAHLVGRSDPLQDLFERFDRQVEDYHRAAYGEEGLSAFRAAV